MNKEPQHSLFVSQLEDTVERWAALIPAELRPAFRRDVSRLGAFHERALTTLQQILERSARVYGVDQATGLATRRPFHDRLAALVSTSTSSSLVGVMFIDVNDLKHINDSRGHQAGDRALAAVGAIVREAVRLERGLDVVDGPLSADTVGRQGGDEFVAALHLGEHASLEDIAQRVKERTDSADLQRMNGYVGPPALTVAIGAVAYRAVPECLHVAANTIATALLAAADELMYTGNATVTSIWPARISNGN
jgi:diguanylate cyclase (GGDEF)-like protein